MVVASPQPSDKSSLATRASRYSAGKALRAHMPRDGHGEFSIDAKRDALAILAETDKGRIPELVPIRYQRMAASPFAFLRGAAAIMAHDFAKAPKLGAPVQSCGDCHLMNFGAFATPEGKVLFDINDFDETLPGLDFTVDLKRLTASVAVAALDAGASEKKAKAVAQSTAKAYRTFITRLAAMTPLDVWHASMDLNREAKRIEDAKLQAQILTTLIKAERDAEADSNFPHLVPTAEGDIRIEDRPPLIYHFDTKSDTVHSLHAKAAFANYRRSLEPERLVLAERYDLRDIAFKVVGIGSVGTFCAVGLFSTADNEHLFLQIKEAQKSVLERIVAPPDGLLHQGRRVVEGQRIMQAASDIFLGWTEDRRSKRQFYVRQLKNRRLGSIGEVIETKALAAYADLCGRTLARAHARSGDPVLIAGYLGKSGAFDDAIASFALTYARQTKHDHAQLQAAMAKTSDKATSVAAVAGAAPAAESPPATGT